MRSRSHDFKLGDVFAIALESGKYGYACLYRGRCVGVVPVISEGLVDKPEDLTTRTPKWYFNFGVSPSDTTEVVKIGEVQFKNMDEGWPPPRFIPADIFQNFFEIIERGQRRRATEAESLGLQRVRTASPESLRRFISNHQGECLRQQGREQNASAGKSTGEIQPQSQPVFLEIVFSNRDFPFKGRDVVEDALTDALQLAQVGEVTGGGSGPHTTNIDVEVNNITAGLNVLRETLRALKAPATTEILQSFPCHVVHHLYD